jgi:hypothetical protein
MCLACHFSEFFASFRQLCAAFSQADNLPTLSFLLHVIQWLSLQFSELSDEDTSDPQNHALASSLRLSMHIRAILQQDCQRSLLMEAC